MKITLQELQALLAVKHGARIVTITTKTLLDMIGKNNPFHNKIYKVSKINGVVNWHYSRAVNRQRAREGKESDFIPKPRTWGTRLTGLPFVSHVTKDGKHKIYLEVKVERVLETKCFYECAFIKDKEIDKKLLEPYLKSENNSTKEHQGVEKEVILRDYDMNNIIDITVDGVKYETSD